MTSSTPMAVVSRSRLPLSMSSLAPSERTTASPTPAGMREGQMEDQREPTP